MSFEHTEPALAQQDISRCGESQYGADDFGRLSRSIEVTRKEGLKTQSAQGLCDVSSFVAALCRELCGVVLALDETQFVPRALTVTHECDRWRLFGRHAKRLVRRRHDVSCRHVRERRVIDSASDLDQLEDPCQASGRRTVLEDLSVYLALTRRDRFTGVSKRGCKVIISNSAESGHVQRAERRRVDRCRQ